MDDLDDLGLELVMFLFLLKLEIMRKSKFLNNIQLLFQHIYRRLIPLSTLWMIWMLLGLELVMFLFLLKLEIMRKSKFLNNIQLLFKHIFRRLIPLSTLWMIWMFLGL